MLNRVKIEGRLASEPKGQITPAGHNVVRFSLAVPGRKGKNNEERPPNFLTIIGWGNQANFALSRLTTGRLVSVDARLDQRSFTDRDGNKRTVLEIIAESFNPLDPPRGEVLG